jgi:hypothetical protein
MTRPRGSITLAVLLLPPLSFQGCTPSLTAPDVSTSCGSFGPELAGVTLNAVHDREVVLAVGERLRLTATVSPPVDATSRGAACPSATRGQAMFHRVSWAWPTSRPFEVVLVSCPCRVVREYGDQNYHHVVAEALSSGEYVFDVVGVQNGAGSVGVTAYVSGPCGGAQPADPVVECGPFALDSVFLRVTS